MIKPGTRIKIPAGVPFLKYKRSSTMLDEWKPLRTPRHFIFRYISGAEICFAGGYAKTADLIAAGVLREENGELFVVGQKKKNIA